MKLIFIFLISFLFVGCSTLSDFFYPTSIDKDPRIEWRKDMRFDVNGVACRGMTIVPPAKTYQIKIYPSDQRIDRLQWRTCHRGDFADKAVEYGIWPWSKKEKYFTMNFSPTPIELNRACPLQLEALAFKHKSMSFGTILFPDTRANLNLPATLECNGQLKARIGTSECQAPKDSIQRITFESEVFQDERPNEQCPPMKRVSEKVFEFFMPKDLCVYVFKSLEKDKSGKFRTHHAVTYGYEQIPPPEGV